MTVHLSLVKLGGYCHHRSMDAPDSPRNDGTNQLAPSDEDLAREDALSALDELVQTSLAYHTPERLRELLDFAARLPRVAPFNAMLLHVQNPGTRFTCTAREWAQRGRSVKLGSRPMVIMKLMGPVSFVFDVADTEGAPLPPAVQAEILDPFSVAGTVTEDEWSVFVGGCQGLGIKVEEKPMGPDAAGQIVRFNASNAPIRYKIQVNEAFGPAAKYVTLAHELAHLFCGHLGADKSEFWTDRSALTLASREMEAEAVANVVGRRRRLMAASAKYLSGYLAPGRELPLYSLEVILKVVHAVEEVAAGKVPSREKNRRKKAATSRRNQELREGKLSGSNDPVHAAAPGSKTPEPEKAAAEAMKEALAGLF